MIDPLQLTRALEYGFVPLHGKCLIELDTPPSVIGLLHIPESAREYKLFNQVKGQTVYGDSMVPGKVLAVTPRKDPKTGKVLTEDFYAGDRVWVMLLMEDLNEKIICTRVERVYAVED